MKYGNENIVGERSGRSISPQFEMACQEVICEALVELMTQKGIYQKIHINYANTLKFGVHEILKKENEHSYEDLNIEFNKRPWQPVSKGLGSDLDHTLPKFNSTNPLTSKDEELYLNFYLPEITTYCKNCKTKTTHLSMASSGRNYIESIEVDHQGYLEQYFVFHYKCSICRKSIINFLITRFKNKMTLCGRSDRLNYNIPKVIPKKFRQIINDAQSSANENDNFAGFYHLRTFVEHFMKDILSIDINTQIRGDDLAEKYNKEVGSKIVGRIPSLSSIYSDLSKFMHSRTGEKKDFDSLFEKIVDHLSAKELNDKYPENA